MKKQNLYILLLAFLVSACTKELEQVNPNVLTEATFWKTENDCLSALASTYKIFKHPSGGYWGVRGIQITNGRGDDVFIRNDVRGLYQLTTFTNDPTTPDPSNFFAGFYLGIFRANQVIKNVPKADISENLKNEFVGEGKFLRGLHYFNLAINFGDVPIITQVPEIRDEYFVNQSPEAEVWLQSINDLKAAKESLPLSYPAKWVGRATRGAAIGYLGKAYLYNKKWAEAENEFKLLSQPSGLPQAPYTYDLLPNYENNFLKQFDNNMESLFEIQLQNVGGNNPFAVDNADEALGVTTAQSFAPPEVAGWFGTFPTNKIFDEFQKEKTISGDFDPRMYASLVWDYPGAMYYNKPISAFTFQFGKKSMFRKYQNWRDNNEGNFISEINEKALRYADILLMYAEAVTMQGRVAEAYPLVNRIRQRAQLAALPTGYNADQMMAEIRHQRMIEFFREGLRFYDLKRWGLLGQEIANSDKEGKQFFQPKYQYFPIPQNELNANPKMTQNQAWK